MKEEKSSLSLFGFDLLIWVNDANVLLYKFKLKLVDGIQETALPGGSYLHVFQVKLWSKHVISPSVYRGLVMA